MENSLEVYEKYSGYWKHAMVFSLLLSLITFLIYLNLDNVLWAGISRLIAFICLSLGIFCLLKIMEGAKTFEITIGEGLLKVTYLKNDKIIGTDEFQIDDIESVSSEPYQIKFPFSDYHITLSDNSLFKVDFNGDEENDIALFKFGGKVLTLDNNSKIRLEHFLSQHDLYS